MLMYVQNGERGRCHVANSPMSSHLRHRFCVSILSHPMLSCAVASHVSAKTVMQVLHYKFLPGSLCASHSPTYVALHYYHTDSSTEAVVASYRERERERERDRDREWLVLEREKEMGFCYIIAAVLLSVSSTVSSCPPSDRAALLAFKAALHEPYLGIFNTWNGSDCCRNWYGVSCDPMIRRVADINLRGESEDPIFEKAGRTGFMTGTISPAICRLTRLSSLTIADWKGITGNIPPCIATLPFLRILDLIGNKISGEIPADIGRLSRLTVLNVADNRISGTIPRSISNLSSLMHLDLRNNQISGTIPRNIGRLRMLSRALLSRNRIGGSIPISISYIYRLSDLDLSLNQILGPIPASLGKMAVLATLNLDGNRISGTIPATLINSSISILNLSRNGLEGGIPDRFEPRSYFTTIDLSHNQLKGPIPKSISSASYIGHLDLSHNHLCGPIPSGSPFDHLEASSFVYNDCLCGKPLRPC